MSSKRSGPLAQPHQCSSLGLRVVPSAVKPLSAAERPPDFTGFPRCRRRITRRPLPPQPYSFYPIFGGQKRDIIASEFLHLAKFEDCLQRLEKIVQELEKGEVPLEKSLTLFEEGMKLSSSCRKELEEAEGKVEILLKQNGKLQAEPFESLTEKTPARG